MAQPLVLPDGTIIMVDRYAQLSADVNGVRTILQVTESELDPDGTNGEWVLCGDAGPDWTTADNGATYAPPAAPEGPRVLAKLDYLKRFTQAERIAIRELGQSNAVVNDYIELMNAAVTVRLDDPDTVGGVNALESAGALAAGRAAEILA